MGRLNVVLWIHANWAKLIDKVNCQSKVIGIVNCQTHSVCVMPKSHEGFRANHRPQCASLRTEVKALSPGDREDTCVGDHRLHMNPSFTKVHHRNDAEIRTYLADLTAVNGRSTRSKRYGAHFIATRVFETISRRTGGLGGSISRCLAPFFRTFQRSRRDYEHAIFMCLLKSAHREMFRHARNERGFRLDASAVNEAVFQGDLARLWLIIELDLVDWETVSVDIANFEGDFFILWMLFESKPDVFCTAQMMDRAAKAGSIGIIRYLTERNVRCPCTRNAPGFAAKHSHLEVLRYFYECRREGGSPYALVWASAEGHAEVVKYLLPYLPNADLDLCVTKARHRGHVEIVDIISEYEATHPMSRPRAISSRQLARRRRMLSIHMRQAHLSQGQVPIALEERALNPG